MRRGRNGRSSFTRYRSLIRATLAATAVSATGTKAVMASLVKAVLLDAGRKIRMWVFVANDNDGRFRVLMGERQKYSRDYIRKQRVERWYVFDGGDERPITIGFRTEEEAIRHRDQIALLYERYGW